MWTMLIVDDGDPDVIPGQEAGDHVDLLSKMTTI